MGMFVFVILHYMSEEMTTECIKQIRLSCANAQYHIILVDNASPNASGKRLFDKFNANNDCTVLLNDRNLGFAQGNNVGWAYARKHLKPEYVIVMNNDVLIKDPSFCEKISQIYSDHCFDVLGPDIYAVRNDTHQNPMRLQLYSREEVEKIIASRERWLRYFPLHYYGNTVLRGIKKGVKQILHITPQARQVNSYYKQNCIENSVLHGACLIFSKRFIRNEEYAFNPNTFLYFEEELLYFYCRKKNYGTLYSSEIQVEHLEDVATNQAFSTEYQKLKMKYQNLIKSAGILLESMDE